MAAPNFCEMTSWFYHSSILQITLPSALSRLCHHCARLFYLGAARADVQISSAHQFSANKRRAVGASWQWAWRTADRPRWRYIFCHEHGILSFKHALFCHFTRPILSFNTCYSLSFYSTNPVNLSSHQLTADSNHQDILVVYISHETSTISILRQWNPGRDS